MKDIKLIIDGKEIELTEEQIKVLNLSENKTSYTRTKSFDRYYYVTATGNISSYYDKRDGIDNSLYNVANYYTNEEFANEQSKLEILNRLLKRFSYENGWSDVLWENSEIYKYFICYDLNCDKYCIGYNLTSKINNTVYFKTEEIAQRAINEIIIPFEKGELDVCKLLEE